MKKNILLILALLALGTQNIQARETTVNLVNWSSNYNIAVLNSSGKWVQIPTKTEIKNVKITTTDSKLQVRACDKTSTICGFSSKGDFTWNGKQSTALDIPNTPDNATLILDAGNSLFSGIEVPSDTKKFSATKTVQEVTFLPNSPILKKISQSVKVISSTTTPPTSQNPKSTTPPPANIPTPPPAPTPSPAPQPSKTPAHYLSKAQFDAGINIYNAQQILGLSEKEMYWLFEFNPQGTQTNPTISDAEFNRTQYDNLSLIYFRLKYIDRGATAEAIKATQKLDAFYEMLLKRMKLDTSTRHQSSEYPDKSFTQQTYATKAQFDAAKATFDANTIADLTEIEMYWLFGFDPKGPDGRPTILELDKNHWRSDKIHHDLIERYAKRRSDGSMQPLVIQSKLDKFLLYYLGNSKPENRSAMLMPVKYKIKESTARAKLVDIVNWSQEYDIAVMAASKAFDHDKAWVLIPPRTLITGVLISMVQVRACKKDTSPYCKTGNAEFTQHGSPLLVLDIKNVKGRDTIVLDAGNSFFSGLTNVPSNIKKVSNSKTIQGYVVSPSDIASILSKVKKGTYNESAD